MRKQEVIKLDEQEITVHELRVFEILEVAGKFAQTGGDMGTLSVEFLRLVPMATSMKVKQMEKLAPSELRLIWETFKRVNSDFFELWGGLKEKGFLPDLRTLSRSSSPGAASSSQRKDTGTPGGMAGGGSKSA